MPLIHTLKITAWPVEHYRIAKYFAEQSPHIDVELVRHPDGTVAGASPSVAACTFYQLANLPPPTQEALDLLMGKLDALLSSIVDVSE
jgi:hypothetical protein